VAKRRTLAPHQVLGFQFESSLFDFDVTECRRLLVFHRETAFANARSAFDVSVLFAFGILPTAIGDHNELRRQPFQLLLETIEAYAGNLDFVNSLCHTLELVAVVILIKCGDGRHTGLEAPCCIWIRSDQIVHKIVRRAFIPHLEGHDGAAWPNMDLFEDDFQGFFTFALNLKYPRWSVMRENAVTLSLASFAGAAVEHGVDAAGVLFLGGEDHMSLLVSSVQFSGKRKRLLACFAGAAVHHGVEGAGVLLLGGESHMSLLVFSVQFSGKRKRLLAGFAGAAV